MRKGWGLSHDNYILARLIDHEETWKYTNGALGCMKNADFEEKK